MGDVADNSVALVVTSPPYFAGKEYEEALGHGHVPATYVEYLEQLRDVFAECVRVLEPGGRIAVNVANLGRRPYRSLSADVTTILQDDLRLLLRGEVLWVKQRGAAGNCAWGSFQRPGNPVLRDLSERVIIASKGRFDRAISAKRSRQDRSAVDQHDDARRVHGGDRRRVGDPARARQPRRPSGTVSGCVARAAHPHEHLCRRPRARSRSSDPAPPRSRRCAPAGHYIGYDTEPEYVEAARRRVAEESTLSTLSAVELSANDGRKTEPLRGGWSSKEIAKWLLDRGRLHEHRRPGHGHARRGADASRTRSQRKDVVVRSRRWSNVESPGAQFVSICCGAPSRKAPSFARSIPSAGFVILTVDQPAAASGGRALAAVTGAGKPVTAVVDMLSETAVSTLAALGNLPLMPR